MIMQLNRIVTFVILSAGLAVAFPGEVRGSIPVKPATYSTPALMLNAAFTGPGMVIQTGFSAVGNAAGATLNALDPQGIFCVKVGLTFMTSLYILNRLGYIYKPEKPKKEDDAVAAIAPGGPYYIEGNGNIVIAHPGSEKKTEKVKVKEIPSLAVSIANYIDKTLTPLSSKATEVAISVGSYMAWDAIVEKVPALVPPLMSGAVAVSKVAVPPLIFCALLRAGEFAYERGNRFIAGRREAQAAAQAAAEADAVRDALL